METTAALILSNDLEVLAKLLASSLQDEEIDPFAPRVILTQGSQMKSWLLLQLAKHSPKGAVSGLKILSWQEGIRYLWHEPGKELSYLQLYLFIYEALRKSEDETIRRYGEMARLHDLAREVTDLFVSYGYYGRHLPLDEGWQSDLWKKIFLDGPWKAPWQLLEGPIQVSAQVYVFGCFHLPSAVWRALFKMGQVQIFHLSPCLSYWTDERSDRERRSLLKFGKKRRVSQRELDELETYLLDSHPLLASLGKMGRSALELFDEYDLETQEVYDPLEEKGSLLNQVQKDLLFHQKSAFSAPDESIQLHQTGSSRLREVQVLLDEMAKIHEKGVCFSEMLVLAPDISLYAPLIEMVFSDPEFLIPYHISGVDLLSQNSAWRGFKRLIDLGLSNWEVDSLLLLFENGSFRSKRGWDLQKLDQIRSWIQDARIRWGDSKEKRKEVLSSWLSQFEASRRGSWEGGIEKIFDSLIYLFPDQEDLGALHTIPNLSLADADEVEELFSLIFQLQVDLAPLKNEVKRPAEWGSYLRGLFDAYFSSESRESLEEVFYDLCKAGEKREEPIPISALLHLFEKKQTGSIGSTLLHAAKFAPFEAGAITPCRALFLLGLDEESFPRKQSRSSLDLLANAKEGPPTVADEDRYLFLQAIGSAKDFLRISYSHISAEDGKEVGPSILVRELMSYVGALAPILHPSALWHQRRLFDPACKPSSPGAIRALKAFQEKKEPPQSGFSFQESPKLEKLETDHILQLKDLKRCFSSPWKFYLEKKFSLYFDELEEKDWSDFELSALQTSQLLKEGLQTSIESVLDRIDKRALLPAGLFGKAARNRVVRTFSEWKGHLDHFAPADPLSSVTFCEEPNGPNEFLPIEIPFGGHTVRIVGTIQRALQTGALHFGKDSFASLLRNWPEHLAALLARKSDQIFCIQTGRVKKVLDPMGALKKCVEIVLLGLKTPLPIASEWADALIRKQDVVELEKKMGFSRLDEDAIYTWVLERTGPIDAKNLIQCWGGYLQESLKDLLDLYPLRAKTHAKI